MSSSTQVMQDVSCQQNQAVNVRAKPGQLCMTNPGNPTAAARSPPPNTKPSHPPNIKYYLNIRHCGIFIVILGVCDIRGGGGGGGVQYWGTGLFFMLERLPATTAGTHSGVLAAKRKFLPEEARSLRLRRAGVQGFWP